MCSLQERTNGIRANRFKNLFIEKQTEVLNELISKWKYLYEIQFSYTDWTFVPKALKTVSDKRKGRKNKDSENGTNVNKGWLIRP